jgi:hypothetical protein
VRPKTTPRLPAKRQTKLVASHDAQPRPVLLRLHDRRLPLPRQILEAGGVEQRLVKLSTLKLAQLGEWCAADDLLDAAA